MAESSENDRKEQHIAGNQVNIGKVDSIDHAGDVVHGDKIGGDKVEGDKYEVYQYPVAPKEPPWQVPEREEHFKGREELIEQVTGEIYHGQKVTLYGIGGIGKTAVVAEVVGQLQESGELQKRFPDGVIFHSFYGKANSDLALEHVLNSLGLEREGDLDGLVRAALGGKALLLILDGAEEADNIERVLGLAPSCGIVISSRNLADRRGSAHEVEFLPLAVSVTVIESWASRVAAEKTAVRDICELVGNWAVAVRIAGAYLATGLDTAEEYLADLRENPFLMLDVSKSGTEAHPKEKLTVLLRKSLA